MKFLKPVLCLALSCFALNNANAQQQVRITFENFQPADGFYLTPVFAGFHDGSFDVFDAGTAASSSLEMLAEEGMVGGLQADFASNGVGQQTVFANPGGFPGAPLLDPGESISQVLALDTNSRFLNFATMLLPTNDSFFGNDNAIAILDALGNFTGNQTINLGIADAWDAGTEINDALGAPFTPVGGTSTDEFGTIGLGPDLSSSDGIATAAGTTVSLANATSSPFLQIRIEAVPEPSSLTLMGAFGLAAFLRRRR